MNDLVNILQKSEVKQDKRTAILLAAAQLFNEKDYHLVTVEEIAKVAGVGKGTIYQYFTSKEVILDEVYNWIIQDYAKKIRALDIKGKTLRESLDLLFILHAENIPVPIGITKQLLNHPIDASIAETFIRHEDVITTIISKLEEIWDQAQAKGELRTNNKDAAFATIVSTIIGLCVYLFALHSEDEMKAKDEILDIVLQGMLQ